VLRLPVVVAVVALLALFAACSGEGQGSAPSSTVASPITTAGPSPSAPATMPDGSLRAPVGLTAVVLTVTRPDGTTVEVCVWVADDQEERAVGLMDVGDPDLGGKAGMVFLYGEDVQGSFWMRNTILPLSIAYVDADGDVVSSTDMEPCPDAVANCPTYPPGGPYRMALEVPQGRLAELGVASGSRLALGAGCGTA
jgi:uncharacterized membrane protein (UPF0127 family)